MMEVFHDKIARELNRRKFVKFWRYRYGERVTDWKKVRQGNFWARNHIQLKSIGEYWEIRTSAFREDVNEELGIYGTS